MNNPLPNITPTYRVMVKRNDEDPIFHFLIKNTVVSKDFTNLVDAIEFADEQFNDLVGETVNVIELRPNGKAPIQRYMRVLWAEGEGH